MSGKDAARNLLTPVAAVRSDTARLGSVRVRQPRPLDLRAPRDDRNQLELTRFELLLVSDLLAGYEDAEIARRASVSQGKLDACLTAMFEKLGVRDSLELALLLVHNGL